MDGILYNEMFVMQNILFKFKVTFCLANKRFPIRKFDRFKSSLKDGRNSFFFGFS